MTLHNILLIVEGGEGNLRLEDIDRVLSPFKVDIAIDEEEQLYDGLEGSITRLYHLMIANKQDFWKSLLKDIIFLDLYKLDRFGLDARGNVDHDESSIFKEPEPYYPTVIYYDIETGEYDLSISRKWELGGVWKRLVETNEHIKYLREFTQRYDDNWVYSLRVRL